jgi:DNA-binding MarR family transcriptional regulator
LSYICIVGIEQDIKQSKFKNDNQKATANILFTASYLERRTQKILGEYKLTLPQFNILRILRGQHPRAIMVNQLIERMLDHSSNASRIVDKLVAKQLVNRTVCPADRRAVDVHITAEGLELLAKIDEVEEHFFFGTGVLSPEELKALNSILDKGRKA